MMQNETLPPVMAGIGAGMIGASWALAFARAGWRVRLFDPFPAAIERGLAAIDRSLATLVASDPATDASAIRRRIQVVQTLEEAVSEARYVQESASEDLTLKVELFRRLDAAAPADTVLASSTSEFPGSRFLETVPGRARCLVLHPLNPPHLIPAVELCPSPWTGKAAIAATESAMQSLGKTCVHVAREVPGFIMNRLQTAVIVEALHLVGEGFCTPADVDAAMRLGLGLRWATMGPFETNHLSSDGGYRAFIEHYAVTLRGIAGDLRLDYPLTAELGERVHQAMASVTGVADHDAIAERRDRNLIRLTRKED